MDAVVVRIRHGLMLALVLGGMAFLAGEAQADPGDVQPRGGGTNQWCVTEDGRDGNGVEGACIDGKGLASGISALQVTPDGKRLHVTGFNGAFATNGNSILTFDRDPTSGFVAYDPRAASCRSDAGVDPCVGGGTGYLSAPTGIAISPNSANVYVTARVSSALSVFDYVGFPDPNNLGPLFTKGPVNGCLVESASGSCTDVRGLAVARDVVMAPDGNTLYTAGNQPDFGGIGVFHRAADGVLSQAGDSTGCVNDSGNNGCANANNLEPMALAITNDGKNLYAASSDGDANDSVTVFDIDPDGTITQKAGAAGCFTTSDSGGTCTSVPGLGEPQDIAVTPDGKSVFIASIVGSGPGTITVFDRDTDTGGLTTGECFNREGDSGCVEAVGLNRPFSLTASDGAIYIGSSGDGVSIPPALVILERDESDGSLSQEAFEDCWAGGPAEGCAELSTIGNIRGMSVSPDGDNLYVGSGAGITVFDRDDGVAPVTTIDSGPTGEAAATGASFSFTADKPVEYFECAFDGDLFQECSSPQSFQGLALGQHTFKVRAVDHFENVSVAPATRTFTVIEPPSCATDTSLCPPPTCATDTSLCPPKDTVVEAVVSAPKIQRIKGGRIVVALKIRADEAVSAKLSGSLKAGRRKAVFKPLTRALKAGTTTTFRLKPAKASAGRALAAAMKDGKPKVPKVLVIVTDGNSNRLVSRPKIRIQAPPRNTSG